MNLDTVIRDVQKAVGVEPDGKPGPMTWEAVHARILGAPVTSDCAVPVAQKERVDDRSERAIATLHARVQPYARALVHAAAAQGITIKVLSGTRTYVEQADLYAKGRTTGGSRVTNAGPGYSNHNFGIAFDIGVFSGSKYVEEGPQYKAVGSLGVNLGLDWGGNWKSIVDEPHFQLRPSWSKGMSERDMLAELRNRKAHGKDAFA